MQVKIPAKRDAVLYVRVSQESKEWLEEKAAENDCSVSVYLNLLIERLKRG